jgi:hypothetical protein
MRYAIVINLDYDTNDEEQCQRIWYKLRQRMVEAGFRLEGRLFTIAQSEADACELARGVVDDMDSDPLVEGVGIYNFLKEFYGYDHTRSVNLLVPPTENILLDEG